MAAFPADTGRRLGPSAVVSLLVALAICYAAAAIGSAFTFPQLNTWYAGLQKPSFNPPNAVFGPVWGILYTLMGIAAWRVWRAGRGFGGTRAALALFALQLVLNVLWSIAFFGLENPAAALFVIAAMWLAIAGTIVAFWRHDRLAAALMVPYLLWVSFATALNAAIWTLN